VGDKSTLQLAVSRIQPDFSPEDIFVATGAQHVGAVQSQLPQLPQNHVIGEPDMRDVGPAVGLMTGILAQESPNEPMVILWSDHLVKDETLFRNVLRSAGSLIKEDPNKIIFVSQKPRFASENLGWIGYGETIATKEGIEFHAFSDFQYKPSPAVAQKYFTSGKYAWNVGYFVTTPAFLWSQYKKFAPNIYESLTQIVKTWNTGTFKNTLNSIYPTLEKIHFDNAILEKLDPKDALVASEDIKWSDIGAWEALKEALEESKTHNVTQGKVLLNSTKDSLVYNYTDQMVATIDLEDMLVVNTGDVLLVCKKGSVSKIKKFVESLSGTEHDHLA
jgi:mannose-1-phosphate guanylyltransferase